MKNLYVIDAAGYLYRSYFAIRNVTNDKGESTNALFGFIRSILKLFKEVKPEHCVAIFDGPDNTRARSAVYADYKAHRQVMPPDLRYQIQWGKDFCKLFGISILDVPGVEADDSMGSVALWAASQGAAVYLCTSDKDLCQIVNDRIFLLDTYKDNMIIDQAAVQTKFGVPPSLIIDYLALMGDSSDNIPGVPGIGPKGAAELLMQFGSLDALLANPQAIPGKKKQEALTLHAKDALLSRQLVTLHTDVDFPKEEAFFALKPSDREALKEFYASMKFNTLLREMDSDESDVNVKPQEPVDYHCIDEKDALDALIRELSRHSAICVDTETTDIHPMSATLVGIGLGVCPKEAWYVPLNGALASQIGREAILNALKPLFANSRIHFYGHNLKYDYHVLRNAGIPIATIGFDTILASYLLNTHSRRHSLDELALENFGFVKTPIDSLLGKGKQQVTMAEVPVEKVAHYCCEDIDYTIRLKEVLEPEIEKRGLQDLYYKLELPLLKVLAEMERRGIYLDVKRLAPFGAELAQHLEQFSKEIYEMAGEEFNLNSPQQISKILFEKMGIRAPKGTSTSSEVLDLLKWEHPIAGKIQEYRVLEKLRSTYVEVLPTEVNPTTGRIHCTFNQSVAATGRLSCQDPNLQNIPVRSEVGLRIRESFRPEKEGWSYVAADYSQIELRLLAHLSNDPVLIAAFNNNEDIHQHTASVVFHVPIDQVSKEMRARSKAVNFGIIYGQGAYGLSQSLGIPQKEAAKFIEMYFNQYPQVKAFLEGCKDRARLTGKAVTLTGRERAIPEILSKNIQIRNAAERLAVNTPFQGSAADLIKMAMLEINTAAQELDLQGYMILQVHDELIFEVPDTEVETFKKLIKDKMENVIKLQVPLLVDLAVGKNWKEC